MASIAQQIGKVAASVETATRSAEFLTLVRALIQSRGNLLEAASDPRVSPRIREIFKAAVSPGNLADVAWAGALAPYAQISDGFVESLRQSSAFDGMLPFMRRAPMRTRLAVVTTALVGNSVAELSAKPVGILALDAAQLTERKATCQVVASEELLRFASPAAITLFNTELRAGVIAATDAQFIAGLIAATTPTASAGTSTANIYTDLGTLLAAVTAGPSSKVFLILHPTRAKSLVLKLTSGGNIAFPNFSITGGEIVAGVVGIVSDQISTSAVLMAVADGIVADSDVVTLRASSQADVAMNTSPDSPPSASTVPLNLWQHDSRALLAERFFAYAVVRSTAVASLSGVAW